MRSVDNTNLKGVDEFKLNKKLAGFLLAKIIKSTLKGFEDVATAREKVIDRVRYMLLICCKRNLLLK
jgi:hypothetical protein